MLIVYKINFIDNDKCYIGITNDYERRKNQHIRNAKNGRMEHIYCAIRKNGYPIFSILEICNTIEELYECEKKYINEFDSYNNGYNMTMGGEGSFGSSRPKTNNWKNTHSELMSGNNNPMFGSSYTEDRKNKHSQIMKEYYKNNPNKKAWKNKSGTGLIWINDGVKNKKIDKNAKIPDGFIRGKITYKNMEKI